MRESVASVLDAVGNTPLIELKSARRRSASARVFAKLEFLNPSGSIKDRMALFMLEKAEGQGLLKSRKIVEATSGNTGISFAMISAARGYAFTAVMPDFASVERRALMKQFGARVVLTKARAGYEGAIKRAREIAEREGAWFADQFENEDNARAHEETTGKEILQQAPRVDAFVAGVGTGGTLVGIGRAVKKVFPRALVVGIEPAESLVLSGGSAGAHGIEGIGSGFVPKIFDARVVDKIMRVSTNTAIAFAKKLARLEGLCVGISSGANVFAAMKIARRLGGGVVVTVLPDSSDRYYSTKLF